MANGQFRNRSWNDRYAEGGMGDEAEGHFEAYCAKKKLGFVRCGLDRPPLSVGRLPARVRYWPDYLMTRGFVEVQGFGRDQTMKLKLDKWGVLHYWNDLMPVELYLWDSTNERELVIGILELDAIIDKEPSVTLDRFPEGKAYFAIPSRLLFGD